MDNESGNDEWDELVRVKRDDNEGDLLVRRWRSESRSWFQTDIYGDASWDEQFVIFKEERVELGRAMVMTQTN